MIVVLATCMQLLIDFYYELEKGKKLGIMIRVLESISLPKMAIKIIVDFLLLV